MPGPYLLNGFNFEYHESRTSLDRIKFFRLAYTGATPVFPQLTIRIQGNDAVLSWNTYFGSYTL